MSSINTKDLFVSNSPGIFYDFDLLLNDAEKVRTFWQEVLANQKNKLVINNVQQRQWFKLLLCSPFAQQVIRQQRNWFVDALQCGFFTQSLKRDKLHEQLLQIFTFVDRTQVSSELRLLRHQEMLRIAFRDINHLDNLNQTMTALSLLADEYLCQTEIYCRKLLGERFGQALDRDGQPMSLFILAMGKLGAYELNFSSDIDLIFVYAHNGQTVNGKRSISHQEYFIKLGQQIIKLLDEQTAWGRVFRVDMRLRPFGKSGPLAINISALETYYMRHGREWERYAMIKARLVNPDQKFTPDLQAVIQSFVYRRYVDYSVFAQLRDMKSMIITQVKQKQLRHHIKLGDGGIREIEFVAQAFQLLRGGKDKDLQQRQVQHILAVLAQKQLIPEFVATDLVNAYVFLRKTENRLQQYADQQTHQLPGKAKEKQRLAYAMGFATEAQFTQQLNYYLRKVSAHFLQLFSAPQYSDDTTASDTDAMQQLWQVILPELSTYSINDDDATTRFALELLSQQGFTQTKKILQILVTFCQSASFRQMSTIGKERLDCLMPMLLRAIRGKSAQAFDRVMQVVETICRRSVYIVLLTENPMALSQLIRLCEASVWISRGLAQYPLLLDELLDPRVLYSPMGLEDLHQELNACFIHIDAEQQEQQMESLRQFKLIQVLRVAAADITGAIAVNQVSDYLTWIAQVILHKTIEIAWQHTAQRYGIPYQVNNTPAQSEDKPVSQAEIRGFAVIGFGKIGGFELGYGSDLDMVFVFDDRFAKGFTQTFSNGQKSVANELFFSRLSHRIMSILGSYSHSGILYECDMRLRPNGHSGAIVTSLSAFAQYEHQQAWLWEHQALCRARWVGGDEALVQPFAQVRQQVLTQTRNVQSLREEIVSMREKMRTNRTMQKTGYFNLKQDPGGLVDIEFMVQYLVLRYAAQYPDLTRFSDNLNWLEQCSLHQILSVEQARNLQKIYLQYRGFIHHQVLQELPAVAPESQFSASIQFVRKIWAQLMLAGKSSKSKGFVNNLGH